MIKYIGIISLVIYLILVLILVVNMRKKNKVIKYSFMILLGISFLVLVFSNEIIINNLLKVIINYLYFPEFTAYLATLLTTLAVLVYTIFNEKMYDKIRIINYVFASLLIVSYIMFMLLNIDINSYNALYSSNSLILLRYGTRTFTLWLVVLLNIKYFSYFLNKRW